MRPPFSSFQTPTMPWRFGSTVFNRSSRAVSGATGGGEAGGPTADDGGGLTGAKRAAVERGASSSLRMAIVVLWLVTNSRAGSGTTALGEFDNRFGSPLQAKSC